MSQFNYHPDTTGTLKQRLLRRLYFYLFAVWHWYARKVLAVPFITTYEPNGPGKGIMALTYSWDKSYNDRITVLFNGKEQDGNQTQSDAGTDNTGNN